MGEWARELFGVPFIKRAPLPFLKALHYNLITLPKTSPSITLEIRIQHVDCGRGDTHIHSDHSNSFFFFDFLTLYIVHFSSFHEVFKSVISYFLSFCVYSFPLYLSGPFDLIVITCLPYDSYPVSLNSTPNSFFWLGSIYRGKVGWLFWDFTEQSDPNSLEPMVNTCSHSQIGSFISSAQFQLLFLNWLATPSRVSVGNLWLPVRVYHCAASLYFFLHKC